MLPSLHRHQSGCKYGAAEVKMNAFRGRLKWEEQERGLAVG